MGSYQEPASKEREREDLIRLLSADDFSIAEREDHNFQTVFPYIVEAQNYEVILYGAAGRGYDMLCWLKHKGIEPLCFVDGDEKRHGTRYFGVDVVHSRHLKERLGSKKVYALICTGAWGDPIQRFFINKQLRGAGCEMIDEIDDHFRQISEYRYWAPYYKYHNDKLLQLYDTLQDEESRSALYGYVRGVICDSGYSGRSHSTDDKYIASDVFVWRDDECMIDGGSFIGDTIIHIVRTGREFEKIYACEMDAERMNTAKKLLQYLPKEILAKIEFYSVCVGKENASSLDEILKNRKVTLIKTDLEGADCDALVGATTILKEQMPVLAVSVYHKKEDLLEIPAFIESISPEYKFFLRKYYSGAPKSLKDEMILYAVPNGRMRCG